MAKKGLSNDSNYGIINQMEDFMSKNAEELVDLITEKRAKTELKAFDLLKAKVTAATTKMITDLTYSEEIELDEDDLLALIKVTEGLRDLGYKFKFIEVQNNSGDVLKHKLVVSVQHLV